MNQVKKAGNRQGCRPQINTGDRRYRQVLEALFCDGVKMSVEKSFDVINTLNESGILSVVVGGIVVGCYSGRPRATQDLDIIVSERPNLPTLKRIGKIVGAKKMEKHPSFISFIVSSVVGDREIVDLITSRAGSYGLALENTKRIIVNGIAISIPTIEMMIVLKYTSAVNPIREKAKQMQDWADIYSIIDAHPGISQGSLERLANCVVPGYGDDLKRKVKSHLLGL